MAQAHLSASEAFSGSLVEYESCRADFGTVEHAFADLNAKYAEKQRGAKKARKSEARQLRG